MSTPGSIAVINPCKLSIWSSVIGSLVTTYKTQHFMGKINLKMGDQHGWKNVKTLLNFPPRLQHFPPFFFFISIWRIFLQMTKFPWNQVPEFPIFSSHGDQIFQILLSIHQNITLKTIQASSAWETKCSDICQYLTSEMNIQIKIDRAIYTWKKSHEYMYACVKKKKKKKNFHF